MSESRAVVSLAVRRILEGVFDGFETSISLLVEVRCWWIAPRKVDSGCSLFFVELVLQELGKNFCSSAFLGFSL